MPAVSLKVTVLSHTPNPEALIATAAKLCYASETDNLYQDSLSNPESTSKFIKRLISLGHMSPVEHVTFNFYIEGVSRALLAQLTRHRLVSFSVRSQRYVKHSSFNYVMPEELKDNPEAILTFKAAMTTIQNSYDTLNILLGDNGEKSNELARSVLPNASETKLIMSLNARQLIHIFEERLCMRSQSEIRNLFDTILNLVKDICPTIFTNTGPKCIRAGHCTEGKMTCGKFLDQKEKYSSSK